MTCVETHYKLGNVRKLTFDFVFDSTDGVPDNRDIVAKFEGRLLKLVTNPGAPAPVANYDIVLNDQNGHDVLEGVGANRHTANTETASIVFAGTGTHPVIDETDTLTWVITNTTTNSAALHIELYYALGA